MNCRELPVKFQRQSKRVFFVVNEDEKHKKLVEVRTQVDCIRGSVSTAALLLSPKKQCEVSRKKLPWDQPKTRKISVVGGITIKRANDLKVRDELCTSSGKIANEFKND